MVRTELDTHVEDTVKLNKKRPTDELEDKLNILLQRSGFVIRTHSENERRAVRGVTLDNHAMVQLVLTERDVIYTRYNEGQYDINQQPVWKPSIEGTKYYAFFPRNGTF